MSNFDKASNLASEWVDSMGGLDNISYLYGDDVSGLVQAIHDAGLLVPDVRIIRTVEELEALDPDSLLVTANESAHNPRTIMYWIKFAGLNYLPAAVIANGAQVRAARKALGQDNE